MNKEVSNAFVPSKYGWHIGKIIELTVKQSSKHEGLNILYVKVELSCKTQYTGTIPLVTSGALVAKRDMLLHALGLDANAAITLFIGRKLKVNVQLWHGNGRSGEGIDEYAPINEVEDKSIIEDTNEVPF